MYIFYTVNNDDDDNNDNYFYLQNLKFQIGYLDLNDDKLLNLLISIE